MTILDKFNLKDRVAVVTGGGGQLGFEFCKTLAEAGATVVAADLNMEFASKTATRLTEAGYSAMAFPLDVTRLESTRELVAETGKADAVPHIYSRDELMKMANFQILEFERQSSFFLTGGLAAVHSAGRSHEAIWDALQRREVYATSGHKILLWFDARDAASGKAARMGGEMETAESPTFTVRAVGSFKQKPGCPDFAKAGMDATRLQSLCSGECDNPSDVRNLITRIEVVRIRPQAQPGEPVDGLIEDKFLVHECHGNPERLQLHVHRPGVRQRRARRDLLRARERGVAADRERAARPVRT